MLNRKRWHRRQPTGRLPAARREGSPCRRRSARQQHFWDQCPPLTRLGQSTSCRSPNGTVDGLREHSGTQRGGHGGQHQPPWRRRCPGSAVMRRDGNPQTEAFIKMLEYFFCQEQGEPMQQRHVPSFYLRSTHKKLTDQLGVFYRAGINFLPAVKRK